MRLPQLPRCLLTRPPLPAGRCRQDPGLQALAASAAMIAMWDDGGKREPGWLMPPNLVTIRGRCTDALVSCCT